MSIIQHKGFILSLFLSLMIGCLGFFLLSPQNTKSQLVTLITHDHVILKARFYQSVPSKKSPSIVLGQGAASNKELLSVFAKELASQGYSVLTPDWRGQGESETNASAPENYSADVKAAVSYLKKQNPESPLAFIGHSMGATVLVENAPEITGLRAVIAYGMDSTTDKVPYFLLGTGTLDEFYPVRNVKRAFEHLRKSNLKKGLAQHAQFFVAPASHSMENINPILIQKSSMWLKKAFPEFIPTPSGSSANRVLFYGLFIWGLTGTCSLLCIHYLNSKLIRIGLRLFLFLVACFSLSHLASYLPLLWTANGLLFFSFILILSQSIYHLKPDEDRRKTAFKTLYSKGSFLLVFSVFIYTIILAINAQAVVFKYMSILDLIFYASRFILSLPWVLQQGIKPHLFNHYSLVLVPAWPFIFIVLEALFSPLSRGLQYLQKKKNDTSPP